VDRTTPDAVSAFRALHAQNRVLVLPNAWDAASAALFAAAGAPAIATSSAGLAWACGYADGDALPSPVLLKAVAAICAVVPDRAVTVDIESGYSDNPQEVADLAAALRALGVVGINLEDGLGSPERLVAKIAAVKASLKGDGDDIFVNARTDVFLRELASGEDAARETIARATLYARAGADGIFAPGLEQPEAIARVAAAVELPLNLMPLPSLPPASRLFALGVRRLSAGASLAKLAYGAALEAAEAFLRDGDCAALFSKRAVDYVQTNALLRQKP
jgi:2-methylisocitrate lyase-like PEP mutase family enzyme